MLWVPKLGQLLRPVVQTTLRLSHGETKIYYRDLVHTDDKSEKAFKVGSTMLWAWVCYHCINNWHMVISYYPFPKRESFTDAELGVEET